ncbi:MAG TPA: ATP-dependent DNA ligase, partial [Phycisphaerae bacterium]
AAVALQLRDMLEHIHLQSFAKTSGGKGIHLYVPLNTPVTFPQTKQMAKLIATQLQAAYPDRITTNMKKDLRGGKVFIDWSQNDAHKTTCCVYSLRARPLPTISMPVSWDEIDAASRKKKPHTLSFHAPAAIKRVESQGDLFAHVLNLKQKLPPL